ncbi:MAG: SDR family oxidoreductase [Phormidesmis sp.]
MTTYLVTGANRGIGYEYCKQLIERGDDVIAVCREPSPELMDLDLEIVRGIDVADEQAIATLTKTLANRPIDVLINNAGIYRQSSLDKLNIDGIREQFEVNAIAPLAVTQALLPNLANSASDATTNAKVAIMTSRMGSIEDNTSGGTYGYRMSKTAVSMAGKSLSHDLKSKGIAVAILHPGLVSTDMTNFNSNGISPEQSVKGLLKIIDALTLENTGTFWHSNGEELPW